MNTDMPATAERPNNGDNNDGPLMLGKILEKIKRRGSLSLSDTEKMFVTEVFRLAAMHRDPKVVKVRNEIQQAHLEYCWGMTK
jgi:hypothetical protein